MPRIDRFSFIDDDQDQEIANRQTASLAGLAVALFLAVLGLFLIRQLAHKTSIEDCLLAGRNDCDLIVQRLR